MSDLYTEVIVKRKTPPKDLILKGLLIVATLLAVLSFFIFGFLGLIILLAVGVADYFLFPSFNVEYEYLYVNGELDVDKIMSKQKRKRVYSANVRELEIMAPTNSHALDYYNNNREIKTYDFSSLMPDHKTYTMILKGEKGMERVVFEPNDTILQDMKRFSPREVNLD